MESRGVILQVTADGKAENCDSSFNEEKKINGDTRSVQRVSHNHPRRGPQLIAALNVIANGLLAGFAFGFSAVAFPTFVADPDRPFDLTADRKSIISSSLNLGQFLGTLLSGPVCRKFGRRWLLIVLLAPMGLSAGLIAFPNGSAMMISGRILQGFFYGLRQGLAQLYTSEVADVSIRGFLLSLLTTTTSFGQVACYVLGSYYNWRIVSIATGVIPLVFIPVFLAFLPESPVWLIQCRKEEEALKVLEWLRGPGHESKKELEDVKRHLLETAKSHATFRDILNFEYMRPFLLALLLAICRQSSGYFPVTYFTVDIFKAAGSTVDPNTATIIVGSVSFFFYAVSALTIDKLGRRRPALVCTAIMAASHATLGAHFYILGRDPSTTHDSLAGWLPIAALMAFVASFSMGFSSVIFVMIGEIIPIQIKSFGTGIALAVNTLTQFAVVQAFQDMRETMGDHGTFWFYGSVCVVSFVVCAFCMPETKGKTLRDIEQNLAKTKK